IKNLNAPGDYAILVEGATTHGVFGTKAHQGWMRPVSVHFDGPGWQTPDLYKMVDLTMAPASSSVADAKANFDKRTAAAVLYNATQPLPPTMYRNEAGFGVAALGRLAYPDYFQSDRLPGRNYPAREEVFEALRRQEVGSKSGTSSESFPKRTGEYDVALSM